MEIHLQRHLDRIVRDARAARAADQSDRADLVGTATTRHSTEIREREEDRQPWPETESGLHTITDDEQVHGGAGTRGVGTRRRPSDRNEKSRLAVNETAREING